MKSKTTIIVEACLTIKPVSYNSVHTRIKLSSLNVGGNTKSFEYIQIFHLTKHERNLEATSMCEMKID